MKQSNLLNAQFARRLFRTAFSSWQLLAVMLIVCMNVAVGSKLYAQSNTIAVVSVSAILSCRPFFILIFLLCIKMKHYGFSRKSIWKNLETFP